MMKYQILDQLQQHKAQLLDSVELGSGMQLAMWQNNQDRVSVCSNHHTLSMYIQGDITVIKRQLKVGIMAVGQIICA
jgi:AraC family transcriptional regulator